VKLARWLPASLATRFALAAAGLAAAALILTSLASWWVIDEQHQRALNELAQHERQFRAAAVGSDLTALAARMAEIAGSTILATGLVDSAGRETYLGPYLSGIRQINGIPVQVMFTDYAGDEIASNAGAHFSDVERAWLRSHIDAGRPAAHIFPSADGGQLVALQPMTYARTASPEGAVLYKVALHDIDAGSAMQLEWGTRTDGERDTALVPVPGVFEHLQFRLRDQPTARTGVPSLQLPYLHIGLIAATLFGLVVLAGRRLARLLTRDLQRLETFSRRLIGSGLSTERALQGGSTEVSNLARSINDMLDRLNAQHLALLSEREKLTELTNALKTADRRKDDFLAMLGHELRNPLSPISAGAYLLNKISGADPRVARTSQMIARQVTQMTKIVDDLLDVSRVTRGLITLDKAPVELSSVVSAAIEQVRPLIESRRDVLNVELPEEKVMVLGDHARLVQVVSNLLSNAAKYTNEGGRIDVSLKATPSCGMVVVQDNGAGISPELMPEIFDLFTQGSRTPDRSQGGLGLGLALVKHLVGLHGGDVQAASDGPGHGATFSVRLPRIPMDPGDNEPPPRVDATTPGSLRVLLVDDNVDAATTLAHSLAAHGHAAFIAHDGTTALALAHARHEPLDVCILDLGLPGMDGWELARRLRSHASTSHSTLIALTGYGQRADRERSVQAGFLHHFVKPVDLDMLHAVLSRVPSAATATR
jgi:signal transduction histidine kinase/CheY-like chemotaxis protein